MDDYRGWNAEGRPIASVSGFPGHLIIEHEDHGLTILDQVPLSAMKHPALTLNAISSATCVSFQSLIALGVEQELSWYRWSYFSNQWQGPIFKLSLGRSSLRISTSTLAMRSPTVVCVCWLCSDGILRQCEVTLEQYGLSHTSVVESSIHQEASNAKIIVLPVDQCSLLTMPECLYVSSFKTSVGGLFVIMDPKSLASWNKVFGIPMQLLRDPKRDCYIALRVVRGLGSMTIPTVETLFDVEIREWESLPVYVVGTQYGIALVCVQKAQLAIISNVGEVTRMICFKDQLEFDPMGCFSTELGTIGMYNHNSVHFIHIDLVSPQSLSNPKCNPKPTPKCLECVFQRAQFDRESFNLIEREYGLLPIREFVEAFDEPQQLLSRLYPCIQLPLRQILYPCGTLDIDLFQRLCALYFQHAAVALPTFVELVSTISFRLKIPSKVDVYAQAYVCLPTSKDRCQVQCKSRLLLSAGLGTASLNMLCSHGMLDEVFQLVDSDPLRFQSLALKAVLASYYRAPASEEEGFLASLDRLFSHSVKDLENELEFIKIEFEGCKIDIPSKTDRLLSRAPSE